jgi:sugar lactone lactonase YvrE
MKKTSSFLTGFLAMIVAAGLLSSAGTAQARLVYTANFASGTIGAGSISSFDTSNPGAGVTTVIGGLTGPIGVATDSLGNIYFSAWNGAGSIQKYTQGGSFISSLATGFPFALAFDSSDNLYYNDASANTTYKTTTSLTTPSIFASGGSGPSGMFIDASGNLSRVNISGDNSFVQTFSSSGTLLDTLTNSPAFNPMYASTGVTRDAAGNYYVSSRVNQSVSKWDSDGNLVNGAYITTGGDAYGLLIDGTTLFVGNHFQSQILYYDLANNGAYLGQFSAGAGALPTYMTFATTAPVPEPGTWAAAALLASGAAFMRWRKRAKVA